MSEGREATPRRGVLGGTFNPPHVAHLIAAHAVRETLGLDHVLLVPSSVHAFKGEAEATPAQRATMTELATAGDPWLLADRIEVRRGGTSYAVDTLHELRGREPGTQWYLILGQDNLAELTEWREAEKLPELAEIVVITRGRVERAPALPFVGNCSFVPVPAMEISSSTIRRRVADGRSIRYWVPAAVEAYIREQGLYAGKAGGGLDEPAPEP